MSANNPPFRLIFIIMLAFCFIKQTMCQVTQPTSFELKSDEIKIQKTQKQWIVQFVCQAWTGNCTIQYIFVPQSWRISGEKIIIPVQDTKKIRSFALQLNVSEPTGDSAIKDVVIDFDNGRIKLNISTVSSQSLLRPSRNGEETGFINTENTGNNPQTNNPSVNQFNETYLQEKGIIESIPTLSRINFTLQAGDIGEIAMVTQDIIEDKRNCTEKLPYLNEVANNYNTIMIETSKNLANKQIGISSNRQLLSNLTVQKRSIERQIALTGSKEEIKKQISRLENQRSRKYSDFYYFRSIADAYQKRLTQLIGSNGVALQEVAALQESVQQDKTEVKRLDDEIKKLQIERDYIQRRINANQKKIRDTTKNGGKIDQNQINSVERIFLQYSQGAAIRLQEFQRVDQELAKAQQRYNNIQKDLNELTDRLERVNQRLAVLQQQSNNNPEINRIKSRLEAIERNYQKIKKAVIDCETQSFSSPTGQTSNQGTSASTGGTSIGGTSTDGASTGGTSTSGTSTSGTSSSSASPSTQIDIVALRQQNNATQQINIYSSNWIMSYGVPRLFRFSCLRIHSLIYGYGRINFIKSSVIRIINETGIVVDLHLGVCSRINAKNSNYAPKIGDIIQWEGLPEQQGVNVFNIHRAEIYPSSTQS